MPINVHDKISKLHSIQRKKVEERAAELTAEELSLRDLRRAGELTQTPRKARPTFPTRAVGTQTARKGGPYKTGAPKKGRAKS
jgi:hypothetical protein